MEAFLKIFCLTGILAMSTLPPSKPSTPTVDGVLPISTKAEELIINHETGGETYYSRFYERPQDPKFSSGVTVGFGYDLKYHTKEQIAQDWNGVATQSEIKAMQSVQGKDGSVYKSIQNKVHITWNEAKIVYRRTTLPRWMKKTKEAYSLPSDFHPHKAGAMVSVSFNRGTDHSNTPRRIELFKINQCILLHKEEEIPSLFYSMQRLWDHDRLKQRRREEGDLYQLGLNDE